MGHDDVETVLLRHPLVRGCAILSVPTGPSGDILIAYVETDDATPEQIRSFLAEARLPAESIPGAVIPMRALPRSASGVVDHAALPLPPLPAAAVGKHGVAAASLTGHAVGAFLLVVFGTVAALLLTGHLWPGSTDLGGVPSPWAGLFRALYLAECLSFGIGVAFLLLGRVPLARLGRSPGWTGLAHLAIVWLLVAWWPQDNLYRLATKTDWPRQAALVYGFNVTLMLAAAVLAAFAVSRRRAD
ncbi:AMP-binding enzyme [Actinoplanes solisilvae]|uniref:AMP-binding enzyme n=1 Tax=Actinoplanes solisilvae TaxID=2486853 RepID=UPI000FD707DA|nr:hypothetical protein [Actinoplanes solisilvae]